MFKSEIYHSVEDDYLEFLEQIKILKENHVFLKKNFSEPSKFFNQFTKSFKDILAGCSDVQKAFGFKNDTDLATKNHQAGVLENFTET